MPRDDHLSDDRRDLTRRRFLGRSAAGLGGAALLGGGALALAGKDEHERRMPTVKVARDGMNVVLISLDTVRADHVGAYRRDAVRPARTAHTPTIDALARQGLRFTRARPEALPTIPTRRGVYTGLRTYPMDHWKPDPGSPRLTGWQPIPANQPTLEEMLKAAGYRTAMVTDNTWMLKGSWKPFQRGWDEFVAVQGQVNQRLHAGHSVRGVHVERYLPPGLKRKPKDKVETMRGVIERYLANNDGREREDDWLVARVFRAASSWLERNRDAQPFFLSIDAYDPHEPWDPPRKYVDRYDDPDYRGVEPIFPLYGGDDYLGERLMRRMRALYAGELSLADHWMGTFLQRLDELGLAERTLVVFYSDHGHCLGERGLVGKQPSEMYAEMVDVPLIARHPQGLAAGKATDFLASLHDIAPTILGAAGASVPEKIEGIDLSPLLGGGDPARGRKIQTAAYGNYVWAGDDRYAFIASNRNFNPKVFDRREDPRERRNLASERKDLANRFWDAIVRDAGGKPPPRYE